MYKDKSAIIPDRTFPDVINRRRVEKNRLSAVARVRHAPRNAGLREAGAP